MRDRRQANHQLQRFSGHEGPLRWSLRNLTLLASVLAITLGTGLLAGCGAGPSEGLAHEPTVTATATSEPNSTPPPTTVPVPEAVTLVAVGDLMLGRSIGQRILASGPGVVFDDQIEEFLRSADVTVGNVESAISDRGIPQSKGYTFRAPPLAVETLSLAGFDVVSLANNHALDYGPAALTDTISLLRDRGIQTVGAGAGISAAHAPAVLERGGLRIAFVGLVDAPAEGSFSRDAWEAQAGQPGVAWADTETVAQVVADARRSSDIVVAMLHFGYEFQASPSPGQQALARAAIDAGAALVIGSHPHVVQDVVEYGGGLITYSLGNFVFDGFDGPSNDSAILRVTLGREGVTSWELVPVEIIDNGLPRLAE